MISYLGRQYLLTPLDRTKTIIHYTDTMADLFEELLDKDIHTHEWQVTELLNDNPMLLVKRFHIRCLGCNAEHTKEISPLDSDWWWEFI